MRSIEARAAFVSLKRFLCFFSSIFPFLTLGKAPCGPVLQKGILKFNRMCHGKIEGKAKCTNQHVKSTCESTVAGAQEARKLIKPYCYESMQGVECSSHHYALGLFGSRSLAKNHSPPDASVSFDSTSERLSRCARAM